MGGSAFSNLGISRIPADSLPLLQEHIESLLTPYYYGMIKSPPPAPGKLDHGDLDLLVLPLDFGNAPSKETLKAALSAIATVTTKGSPTISFAVPFPRHLAPAPGALFQLDIHVCASPHDLEWVLFQYSYGDFWNIVGAMARRVGLKIDNTGMHLRLGEGETLLLTAEPVAVLEFLGFEQEVFSKGEWESLEDMFAFIRECRFFTPEAFAKENESQKDRQRATKRHGWIKWKESLETIPPSTQGKIVEAEEVRVEALERFGKKREYEKTMQERANRARLKLMWKGVMAGLPLETDREKGLTLRRLRTLWESVDGRDLETLPTFAETHWKAEWEKAMEREAQTALMPKKVKRKGGVEVASAGG
ncbi:hypothetical protein FN846DRAFT_275707 [Sphaerosporella brunnea]|uniref:Uncharacterized protein n=1 Tax=Sphaerosporella brunnea TaxID=1250544 RepID=A0A5J5EMZ7_9PEZI|nr:hypothetical protein FN846DRAFT_275707 [Sphaerosporella brunnea]